MTVAAICCLSYLYRSDPVRAPCCRWQGYARFCLQRDQRNKYHWNTTDPTRGIIITVTSDIAEPYRKLTTQIPIAPLPSITVWLRPAVSSLEACQTPAR